MKPIKAGHGQCKRRLWIFKISSRHCNVLLRSTCESFVNTIFVSKVSSTLRVYHTLNVTIIPLFDSIMYLYIYIYILLKIILFSFSVRPFRISWRCTKDIFGSLTHIGIIISIFYCSRLFSIIYQICKSIIRWVLLYRELDFFMYLHFKMCSPFNLQYAQY